MISLCKAMGGSWYPYKETAVSTYGNCGIHTWTLSFPALETAVSRLGTLVSYAGNRRLLAWMCTVLDLVDNFVCYT
ncbi:hypothetical protein INE92_03288 [Bacteroides xylanisolvens]|nr:hypothetical protein INE92_03288 [Bacteroides xylanisolvens]